MIREQQYNQCFYFIPLQYEKELTNAIEEWVKTKNGWTIITGVYAPSEILYTGFSTVKNILRVNREKQDIVMGYEDVMTFGNPTIMALIGFTLNGDLDLYTPTFKEELMKLEGVVCIKESEQYLEFLKQLQNGNI
jgi:hypothetical protein